MFADAQVLKELQVRQQVCDFEFTVSIRADRYAHAQFQADRKEFGVGLIAVKVDFGSYAFGLQYFSQGAVEFGGHRALLAAT